MIDLRPYKLISFDMFQTIVDLNSQKSVVLKHIFQENHNTTVANLFWSDADAFMHNYFHKIATNDKPYKTVTDIFTDCYECLFRKYGIKLNARQTAEFLAKAHNDSEPYPDSLEVIKAIKSRKNVCIISDTDNAMIGTLLTKFGIDKVYSSQDFNAYKFDKSGVLFRQAIQDFNINPRELIHVGDGASDVLGANRAGADSVWINRNHRKWTETIKPTYVIESLRELIE